MAKKSGKTSKADKVKRKKTQLPHLKDADDLSRYELAGSHKKESLSTSETDVDENEGTGNAQIQRSDDDPLK